MSQSFVCLFNRVWVGISQTGLTPLHFMGLSQVRNLFGNGPVSYCFVYIIWIWDVFVRWVVVFVQNLSFFIYKGPIRACRRVRVYSSHWSHLMGILPSSFFLLYYVTAAIFQLYNKLNSTCTYSFIGSLSSNGPTFSKYSNMLICSTCRFRQLATSMSCSVMQEISLSSMLMITVEIAWQQMHSSADSHSHLKWLNKLMQITSPSMSWKKSFVCAEKKVSNKVI